MRSHQLLAGAEWARAQTLYEQSVALYESSVRTCTEAQAACAASAASRVRRRQSAAVTRSQDLSPNDAALLLRAACDPLSASPLMGALLRAVHFVLPDVELGVLNWAKLDALQRQRRHWQGRAETEG